ncbi:hypothetical protein NKDENANG_02617 [Candidatus Entotheonellaceae bacterium PAL068K]
MVEKTVTTTARTPQDSPATAGTSRPQWSITPPVDIYETSEELVVIADIPGVSPKDLDVCVNFNLLTIRGQARHTAAHAAVYREYEPVDYVRQFEISDTVNLNDITAELKQGVLVLHVPKADAAKPRRIAVQVG